MTTRNLEIPPKIVALPRDEHGRPVPFFVTWVNGKPDFRIVNGMRVAECYLTRVCFICGQKLGTYLAFVLGPMSVTNMISAEPPSHYDCALYAVKACPFLANPRKEYRDGDLPDDRRLEDRQLVLKDVPMVAENPGVTAIWVAKTYRPLIRDQHVLCQLDEPVRVEWYKEGRTASREEVAGALQLGAGRVFELAGDQYSTVEFEANLRRAQRFLPEGEK